MLQTGQVPLHRAARGGHFAVVNALLAFKANPNLHDKVPVQKGAGSVAYPNVTAVDSACVRGACIHAVCAWCLTSLSPARDNAADRGL